MFQGEQKGLQTIEATQTIAVPYVYLVDSFENKSFLLMDFVESKRPDSSDFQRLGTQLAELHQCSQSNFGFSDDNFIGSLPQSNTTHKNWVEFYWKERILPQLEMALDNQLLRKDEIPEEEKTIAVFNRFFGKVTPSRKLPHLHRRNPLPYRSCRLLRTLTGRYSHEQPFRRFLLAVLRRLSRNQSKI